MQTFLPYLDFKKCAQVLDRQRLGKQRVEARQILNILSGKDKNSGWKNHPNVKRWKGFEPTLRYYLFCMMEEWAKRGYRNIKTKVNHSFFDPSINFMQTELKWFDGEYKGNKYRIILPPWLTTQLVRKHRESLMKKKPDYYYKFRWKL